MISILMSFVFFVVVVVVVVVCLFFSSSGFVCFFHIVLGASEHFCLNFIFSCFLVSSISFLKFEEKIIS